MTLEFFGMMYAVGCLLGALGFFSGREGVWAAPGEPRWKHVTGFLISTLGWPLLLPLSFLLLVTVFSGGLFECCLWLWEKLGGDFSIGGKRMYVVYESPELEEEINP